MSIHTSRRVGDLHEQVWLFRSLKEMNPEANVGFPESVYGEGVYSE